jgi:hypothetical protein
MKVQHENQLDLVRARRKIENDRRRNNTNFRMTEEKFGIQFMATNITETGPFQSIIRYKSVDTFLRSLKQIT